MGSSEHPLNCKHLTPLPRNGEQPRPSIIPAPGESPKVFAQSPVLQLHLPKDPRQPMFWSNIEGEHSVGGHSGAIFGAFSKVNSPLAKRTTPSNDRACPLQDLCPQPVINLDLSSRRSSKTSEGAIATTGGLTIKWVVQYLSFSAQSPTSMLMCLTSCDCWACGASKH